MGLDDVVHMDKMMMDKLWRNTSDTDSRNVPHVAKKNVLM